MAPAPDVSVIIPTRNRWHILSRWALPAALMQEDVSIEVIVVDDGSSDGTQAGLARSRDRAVRVLRSDVSRGVSAARNRGIEVARGEWLAFLDDDDIWAPRKLCTQIDRARREGAGFAFSAAVTVDRARRPLAYTGVPDTDELGSLFFHTNVVPGGCSNVVAHAALVRRLGGFDEQLSMLADWDLWLRLALETRAARCPDVHVGYLKHEGNMAVRTPGQVFRESTYFAQKHERSAAGRYAVDLLAPVRWVAWENFWTGHRARAGRMLLRAGIAERSWGDIGRGLRFLVWASAPERLSHRLWRLRHARDGARAPDTPPPQPDWLEMYDGRASLGREPPSATLRRRAKHGRAP